MESGRFVSTIPPTLSILAWSLPAAMNRDNSLQSKNKYGIVNKSQSRLLMLQIQNLHTSGCMNWEHFFQIMRSWCFTIIFRLMLFQEVLQMIIHPPGCRLIAEVFHDGSGYWSSKPLFLKLNYEWLDMFSYGNIYYVAKYLLINECFSDTECFSHIIECETLIWL